MENHNTIVNINSYLASFSICEMTSFEVQTRDIRISLRGPSITKKNCFIAVQCENDVFDKGKEFHPAFSHQIFGQK